MPTPFDLPSDNLDEAQVAQAINRLNAMVFGKTTMEVKDGKYLLTVHDWPGGEQQFRVGETGATQGVGVMQAHAQE